jgi:membrane associated rhomboid family serine protease
VIPIGDNVRLARFPAVTRLLVLINVAVFVLQYSSPDTDFESVYLRFGVVPARIVTELGAVWRDPMLVVAGFGDFVLVVLLPLITSMFLHAGPLHLLGNMVFLWIFGDNVEDRMGRARFLAFYLLCGVVVSGLHVALEPAAHIPVVGASGAIAGALGAFMLMFPRARVLVLVFFFVVEAPAFAFLAVWFLFQLPMVNGTLPVHGIESVAYWAHVGGFVAGLLLVFPFLAGARPRAVEVYRQRRW